jgi:hypothetical protein
MGRTERSDLRSWTNCHSCRRRARIRRASVPLVAERSLIGIMCGRLRCGRGVHCAGPARSVRGGFCGVARAAAGELGGCSAMAEQASLTQQPAAGLGQGASAMMRS